MNDKQKIIAEIKRTAKENDGVALGREKFFKVTGIKQSDWHGKYWRTWSDALQEAGFGANSLAAATDKNVLLLNLAKLTRKLKRFPANIDLRMERKVDSSIPSHNTFNNLGSIDERIELVRKYAADNKEFNDILPLLPESEELLVEDNTTLKIKEGFVYMFLMQVGKEKHYKIGKSVLVERRSAEVSLHLPEDVTLVHTIKTDDAYGIEAYWHERFSDKCTGQGKEWFKLTKEDIQAFKKRKFM